MPLSQTGAELLFEVFSQRYERGSTVVTSNLPFDEWTSVFGSERLTGALLDRLTHHVNILQLNGNSYSIRASADHTVPVPIRRRIISTKSDTGRNGPAWGLLPASLMYFCLGRPMHHCSGVDTAAACNRPPLARIPATYRSQRLYRWRSVPSSTELTNYGVPRAQGSRYLTVTGSAYRCLRKMVR